MKFSAKMIAGFLKGEIEGDETVEVSDISKIEEGKEGTLSFLANPKYNPYLYTTQASIILINRTLKVDKTLKCTLIRVDDPYQSFASLLQLVDQSRPVRSGIEANSFVSNKANIGQDVYIGAFTYISDNAVIGKNAKIFPQVYIGDNVVIGDNTVINPGVKIYHDCKVGTNCVIHAGTVIGSDGFGFAPQAEDNVYNKIPQIGNVVIEDNVEIGSNTSIDRATMGSTHISKGVKIDNLVHIAHNVEIGENTVLAAQAGLAGSAKVGRDCMSGGQIGIAPHVTIANGVKIGAQAGINRDIKDNETIIGSPAIHSGTWMKQQVVLRKLPDMKNQLDELIKEVKELKTKLDLGKK